MYQLNHCSQKLLMMNVLLKSRVYNGVEKRELLYFKGNDATGSNEADRIRLRAGNVVFDTYSTATTDRNTENIRMHINENWNVGIGSQTPKYKLDVNGSLNISSENDYYMNGTSFSHLYLFIKNCNIKI